MVKTEHANCVSCGLDNAEFLFTKKESLGLSEGKFTVVRCKNCGLIYVDPRPTREETEKFYPDFYFWKEEKSGRGFAGNWVRKAENFYRFHLLDYETDKVLERASLKEGRVLDLGCGTGDRLQVFKNRGFQVYGVEISESALTSEKGSKSTIFLGTLDGAKFPDGYFDMVVAYNVLEHLHRPAEVIREVKRVLKKDGFFVVQIPNVDSLQFRFFKKRWSAFDVPRDLYYFNLETVSLLFQKEGMKPEHVDYSNNWMHPPTLVLTLFPFLDPRRIWKGGNRIKNMAKRLTWAFFTLILSPFCVLENFLKRSAVFTLYLKNKT